MVNILKWEIKDGIYKYILNTPFLRSEEVKKLIDKYIILTENIVQKRKNNKDITSELAQIKSIKNKILNWEDNFIDKRNVLKWTSKIDKRIWFWKDNNVYEFQNNWKYVYKESGESDINNLEYSRKKYLILKKYLGDFIPKSYFVLWESFSKTFIRWLKNIEYISTKLIIIQKKVDWKDVSKMSFNEKQQKDFLTKLKKGHKKYVLLKYFLQTQLEYLWLDKKSMDIQLDLWHLSNRDNFHYDELDFIEWKLNSPNIMWDGNHVFFIDYWSWKWDKEKEILFERIMDKSVFKKWEKILEAYNLS